MSGAAHDHEKMKPSTVATPVVPLAAITGSLLLGGASTFLLNLSKAFARRGHLLPIVVLSEVNEHAADFARVGNPVQCIPASKLIYEDRLERGYRELARHAPRAVLSCLGGESFEVLRLLPPGVARLGIIQSHEPGPYQLARVYPPHLDAMIGVSREIEHHLRLMPEMERVRVEYIPYGIDFNTAPPVRVFDGLQPLRVIYLGRLIEEQKRVSRLVELVRRVEQAGQPVEFTFAGGGPDEAGLRAQCAGAQNVRFTGAVSNDQARGLLAEHDVFVLLSDYEGLPVSLLEAMGQGLVPVVSDLASGMREVVVDDCGFRVSVGDVTRAAEIISMLARERWRLRPLADRALTLARADYNADRMAERYLKLVSESGKLGASWPERIEVPVPYGMRPWLYRGLMRRVWRRLKPLLR